MQGNVELFNVRKFNHKKILCQFSVTTERKLGVSRAGHCPLRYKSCLQSGGLVCPDSDPRQWKKPNPPPAASTPPASTGHVVGVCSEN